VKDWPDALYGDHPASQSAHRVFGVKEVEALLDRYAPPVKRPPPEQS
jgi:hypothetical protein